MPKITRKSGGFGRRLSSEGVRQVTAALFGAAEDIAVEAALSITQGAVSGKGHVPSRPGEPPNADTGLLDRSVNARTPAPLVAESYADAPYAASLEFGTSKMAARPFLRPAGQRRQKEVKARLAQALKRIASGGRVTSS